MIMWWCDCRAGPVPRTSYRRVPLTRMIVATLLNWLCDSDGGCHHMNLKFMMFKLKFTGKLVTLKLTRH